MTKYLISCSIAFFIFLSTSTILYKWPTTNHFFRRYTYKIDFYLRSALDMSPTLSPKIKIYSYDDKTISYLQRTDYYIDEWNKILQYISSHHPRVIMLDKLFSITNDPYKQVESAVANLRMITSPLVTGGFSPAQIIRTRKPIDLNFHARSIKNLQGQGILRRLGSSAIEENTDSKILDSKILDLKISSPYYGPSRKLFEVFPNVGNITTEANGEVKPFIRVSEDHVIPHFSLYAGKNIKITDDSLFVDDKQIPLNSEGNMLGNFSKLESYYKNTKIIQSLVELEKRGKKSKFIKEDDIVLILPSLNTGSADFHDTPIGEIPGGFILATFINSILKNEWLTAINISFPLILLCCFLGAGFSLATKTFTFWIAFPFILVLLPAVSIYLFIWEGIIIPWIFLSYCFAGSAISIFAEKSKENERQAELEAKKRQEIKDAFSRYLNEDVIDEINENPEKLKLGGVRKNITVLFSDVRGFTSISESLNSEELCDYMNQYLTPMTDIVMDRRGVLDKYIGDAVMAFWGAPVYNQDHPKIGRAHV